MTTSYARACWFECNGCHWEEFGYIGHLPEGWVEVSTPEQLQHFCPACPEKKVLAPVAPKALP